MYIAGEADTTVLCQPSSAVSIKLEAQALLRDCNRAGAARGTVTEGTTWLIQAGVV